MSTKKLTSVQDIFDLWKPFIGFAEAVKEPEWRVRKWKHRQSIPTKSWAAVVRAVRKQGHTLTANDLLSMHSRPVPASTKKRSASAVSA